METGIFLYALKAGFRVGVFLCWFTLEFPGLRLSSNIHPFRFGEESFIEEKQDYRNHQDCTGGIDQPVELKIIEEAIEYCADRHDAHGT